MVRAKLSGGNSHPKQAESEILATSYDANIIAHQQYIYIYIKTDNPGALTPHYVELHKLFRGFKTFS